MSAAGEVRARRAAALRLVPLECGHADPLDCAAGTRPVGDTYGLDRGELLAEVRRLAADGWQVWEIRRRFALDVREAA